MNNIVAGLVAAIPLSVLSVIYMRMDGRRFIQTLREEEFVELPTLDDC